MCVFAWFFVVVPSFSLLFFILARFGDNKKIEHHSGGFRFTNFTAIALAACIHRDKELAHHPSEIEKKTCYAGLSSSVLGTLTWPNRISFRHPT
jgi:hypothetical protein